ncbi:hypothetical protein DAEQUDRAFT_770335 [Daedalea quercina L-15889]|uniref:Protein SQS1 n=1 Tax=Daedalea quercina L-15889 TaxID=1314783 RepID=A0A165KXY2_9APHY|nr:hypothetical protein DAEQUDRAFT_770335 [Daedalea quercina L-15889]
MDSPRGRGFFRGRGRGDYNETTRGRGRPSRGQLNSRLRAGVPLSKLLNEDRPLLKPIVFVRSVHTATLFQQEEDILQPLVEPVAENEKSHVPTAEQVSRVFNGQAESDHNLSGAEEEIKEIDFADLGKLQAEVDAIATTMAGEHTHTRVTTDTKVKEETFAGFFVDTTPAPVTARSAPTAMTDRMEGALGEDDEIIVYVAPHPRLSRAPTPATLAETITTTSILTGRELTNTQQINTSAVPALPSIPEASASPGTNIPPVPNDVDEAPAPTAVAPQISEPPSIPEPPSFESISFSFETSVRKKQTRRLFPVGGPRSLLPRSKKARRRRPRHLGAFGAAVSEAQARREGRERDPREAEQRRGDSDVNFGESSEDDAGVEEVSNGVGAMDLDVDAGISLDAMKSFVKSMSAEGSRHVTMDDIADGERMRAEDAQEEGEDSSRGSDEESEESDGEEEADEDDEEDKELEETLDAEERALVGEVSEDDEEQEEDEDEDDSSDENDTPKTGFQARLARMRARDKGRNNGKGKARQMDDSSDEDMETNVAWADEDEDFIAEIEEMLDANAYLLSSGDRKARKKLFKAVEDGVFDDDEFATMRTPAPRKKDTHVPQGLQEQWDKDRQKKAENKRRHAEARIAVAADPLAVHKGGKKGRKAMLAAAKLDSHVEVENRVVGFVSLEAQIRRFLADISGKGTMALPPCDKDTRKKIHELASAFNLKSESKGKGTGRYTTLVKTSRSGIAINEKKIRGILKRNQDSIWDAPGRGKGKGRAGQSLAKHREGEEVGKAAPKISQSNIGFRMLAAMGWAEGDRIGLSGGLDAPLTAKMKKTKLGLGATM